MTYVLRLLWWFTNMIKRFRRNVEAPSLVLRHKTNFRATSPLVSLILLDWSVRELFYALDWLSVQNVPRDAYEIIWVELYDRVVPEAMEKADVVITCGQQGLYHKHEGYNIGLLNARGKVITVCDSDAVFPPDFVESIIKAFELDRGAEPNPLVLMHYQWRSIDPYPVGLNDLDHLDDYRWAPLWPNVGACMSVTHFDAVRFGGFDEHPSFRGYMCGPYDLGWRLVNAGVPEIWHDTEVALWHFAHDNPMAQFRNKFSWRLWGEIAHPHVDGHALTALEAFSTGRIFVLQENADIRELRMAKRVIGTRFEEKYASMDLGHFTARGKLKLRLRLILEPFRTQLRFSKPVRVLRDWFGPVIQEVLGQRGFAAVRARILGLAAPAEKGVHTVTYMGNLFGFDPAGLHPQFNHLATPPHGYTFLHAADDISGTPAVPRRLVQFIRLARLAPHMVKLAVAGYRRGAAPRAIVRFFSRQRVWCMIRTGCRAKLAFLPWRPCTFSQYPWVIEIEDPITLFHPFVENGTTNELEVRKHWSYPLVKALLESHNCRGVICHVKSAAESLPILFNNPDLGKKVTYLPLGWSCGPNSSGHVQRKAREGVQILFTNSWHQAERNFYLRGGIDLLEAFEVISSKYPEVRLTMRTKLPEDLPARHRKLILNEPRIRIICHFISDEDMGRLMDQTDIYVLPAARIHVVSILQAMAHGLSVVVSDGWGIEEYVEHGRNGLVVRGRYGKCSWMGEDGMLRENYEPLFSKDPEFVDGLAAALSSLIENPELRANLGREAREDVITKYTVENWNRGLKESFDRALSGNNSG